MFVEHLPRLGLGTVPPRAERLRTGRVGHDRTRQRAKEVGGGPIILAVTAERVAVGHLPELPHALAAHRRLRPVGIEVPRRPRRWHGAAGERRWAAGGFAGR